MSTHLYRRRDQMSTMTKWQTVYKEEGTACLQGLRISLKSSCNVIHLLGRGKKTNKWIRNLSIISKTSSRHLLGIEENK